MEYLHTMVRASNLEDSLDFYCNKLGLVEISRFDNEAGRFTLVFLAASDDAEKAQDTGAATRLLCAPPMASLLNYCKRVIHCRLRNPGLAWKTSVSGRP